MFAPIYNKFFKFDEFHNLLFYLQKLMYNILMKKFITFFVFFIFCFALPVEGKINFSFKKSILENKSDDNFKEDENKKNILVTLDLRNDAVAFYNVNDLDNSYQLLMQIPDNQKVASDWLMLANIAQDKGNIEETVELLQKSIQADKKFYKAYYNLANVYYEKKDIENAILNYKKTISLNKDFAHSYYNLGVCYVELEKYKTAKSYFNRAILRKPDEPNFYYNLAFVYKKLKDEKKAQKALNAYNELINR